MPRPPFSRDCYLREAASIAYAKMCATYHIWEVRTAVSGGMYALPTREHLLLRLNESGESAEKEMQRYIDASLPIISKDISAWTGELCFIWKNRWSKLCLEVISEARKNFRDEAYLISHDLNRPYH